ncbi:putative bifunctional diguanylate cyclase/phosphodiesterase [Actinoplanes rectilineatus]|uniref:putative bifunctional diguanylate cyclase/phosphodiesterase n=1 Tax=Actinoplanes rectilineatus TaxID=113571 RepID=UPI0005F27F41|nr:EAL domain-containing protein [Actinoplanes rectilineatus]
MSDWSARRLTAFFAAVCEQAGEQAAFTVAAEQAAETLAGEIGAVLRNGLVAAGAGSFSSGAGGFSSGAGSEALGAALAAAGDRPLLHLDGRELHLASARFGPVTLLVARAAEPFASRERQLLQAMAQSLVLALHSRTLTGGGRQRHDALTGLPTRAAFLATLDQRLRTDGPVSVLFVDLDRFKAVNDSLGHPAGDELLGLVAARIRGCLPSDATAARLGSDEFAVLLPDATTDEALPVAYRIVDAIRQPFPVRGHDVFVGAGIGVATASSGTSAGDLLGSADIAMDRAKQAGAGQVVVYAPHMHTEALARLTLDGDLQRAVELGEFRLQYQPLFALATGEATGVEALVRWQSSQRGYVSPGDFVPMAEENGLIRDIGRWVLDTAGEQAVRWRATMPELTLNVNVSGRQLTDPVFAEDVERILARRGLPASAVILELTESVLMSDPRAAIACLSDLKALGVGVSVDDFGTGYSSLSYLRRLPVDELKIDRAFLSRAEPTREDLAVVRAVVDLARTLRLRTVVEGIETEFQRQAVRALGCDLGQGYHLCRPVHPEDVPAAVGINAVAVI